MEEALPSEEEPAVAAVDELAPVSQSSPVITVVSVVVTASILSLFVVAASTNEALRPPPPWRACGSSVFLAKRTKPRTDAINEVD